MQPLRNCCALLVVILLVACGSDEDSADGNSDCRGTCPASAALDDPEAACAEIGGGKAYCFIQNSPFGALETSVNCPASGGHGLAACFNGEACKLNADNSEASCE